MALCVAIIAFVAGFLIGSGTVEKYIPLDAILSTGTIKNLASAVFSTIEGGSNGYLSVEHTRSVFLVLLPLCIILANFIGLNGYNLISITLTLVLAMALRSLSKADKPVADKAPEKKMRDKVREIINEALVKPVTTEPKKPFDTKVEVGEQDINLEQTRRVVLEALLSIASLSSLGESPSIAPPKAAEESTSTGAPNPVREYN